MTITVRLADTLVELSARKEPEFQVDHRDGMTVWDLILEQGFRERDAEAIAAIINDEQGEHDDLLRDGDTVELLVSISGG